MKVTTEGQAKALTKLLSASISVTHAADHVEENLKLIQKSIREGAFPFHPSVENVVTLKVNIALLDVARREAYEHPDIAGLGSQNAYHMVSSVQAMGARKITVPDIQVGDTIT